jgi:ATP-dependent Clp protease ATP-binding subunit ClpC
MTCDSSGLFEKFTERARHVVVLAQEEARALRHHYIGTEHILLGLVRENDGVAARILLDFDVNPDKIRKEVFRVLADPGAEPRVRSRAVSSREAPQVIDRGWLGGLGVVVDELGGEIRRELQRAPETGDLLLALASASETLAGRALRELGADLVEPTHPRHPNRAEQRNRDLLPARSRPTSATGWASISRPNSSAATYSPSPCYPRTLCRESR